MGKVFSKRNLYILCTVIINIIEVIRNDYSYEAWAMATNLTGMVVFALILTQIDIKKLLVPSSGVISFFALIAIGFAGQIRSNLLPGSGIGQIRVAVLNIWWILIVGIYYFKRIVSLYKREKRLPHISLVYALWTMACFLVLISRSEAIWPVWLWGVFSLFYFTEFNKQDRENLWDSIVTGSIWAFVIIQIAYMPFRPYDIARYSGFMINANNYGSYVCIIFVMVLIKCHSLRVKQAKIAVRILYAVVGVLLLDVSFMSACRTIWVIEVVEITIFIFAVMVGKWKLRVIHALASGVGMIVAFIILLYPTYFAIRYVPTIHPHPIWFANEEYSEDRVHSWDERDSDKYVSFGEMFDASFGRFIELMDKIAANDPLVIKASAKEIVNVEDVTVVDWVPHSVNDRLNYYKAYISKMNMRGNNSNNIEFVYNPDGADSYHIWHAQNFLIQISFMFGIPVGILAFALLILLFVRNVRIFSKEDSTGFNILPLLYTILYVMYGLMEVTWLPGYIILTMMFIVQHPQFDGSINSKDN